MEAALASSMSRLLPSYRRIRFATAAVSRLGLRYRLATAARHSKH